MSSLPSNQYQYGGGVVTTTTSAFPTYSFNGTINFPVNVTGSAFGLSGGWYTQAFYVNWDKSAVKQKIEEAQEYIKFLTECRDRLKNIVG